MSTLYTQAGAHAPERPPTDRCSRQCRRPAHDAVLAVGVPLLHGVEELPATVLVAIAAAAFVVRAVSAVRRTR